MASIHRANVARVLFCPERAIAGLAAQFVGLFGVITQWESRAGCMAGDNGAGYLTSGQVARLLGVSKGTVLRAVTAGRVHAAYTMPGGALRFMPAEVERYVQWLRRARQLDAAIAPSSGLVPILLETAPGRGEPQVPELLSAPPRGEAVETPDSFESAASAWELLALRSESTPQDAQEETAMLLALVAESLQVGAACLARLEVGMWQIVAFHDRAGMELHVGGLLPHGAVFGPGLARGTIPALIVEDLHADARYAAAVADATGGVGAITAVPLAWADGQPFGVLCTLHPHARSVASGEIPLLRLAGRMLLQAELAARALAREQQAARQAAVFAAMIEYSDDAIITMSLGGQIETWNAGATRLYGYTAAEVVGQPIGLLAPPDRADELPILLARMARGERVDHLRRSGCEG